jgi:hypothetical protein
MYGTTDWKSLDWEENRGITFHNQIVDTLLYPFWKYNIVETAITFGFDVFMPVLDSSHIQNGLSSSLCNNPL